MVVSQLECLILQITDVSRDYNPVSMDFPSFLMSSLASHSKNLQTRNDVLRRTTLVQHYDVGVNQNCFSFSEIGQFSVLFVIQSAN